MIASPFKCISESIRKNITVHNTVMFTADSDCLQFSSKLSWLLVQAVVYNSTIGPIKTWFIGLIVQELTIYILFISFTQKVIMAELTMLLSVTSEVRFMAKSYWPFSVTIVI